MKEKKDNNEPIDGSINSGIESFPIIKKNKKITVIVAVIVIILIVLAFIF